MLDHTGDVFANLIPRKLVKEIGNTSGFGALIPPMLNMAALNSLLVGHLHTVEFLCSMITFVKIPFGSSIWIRGGLRCDDVYEIGEQKVSNVLFVMGPISILIT